jgi:hypothetical protein
MSENFKVTRNIPDFLDENLNSKNDYQEIFKLILFEQSYRHKQHTKKFVRYKNQL